MHPEMLTMKTLQLAWLLACDMSMLTLRQQAHDGRHTWQGQPGQLLHECLEAPLAPQPRPQCLRFRVLPHAGTQLHTGCDALLQK